MPRATKKIVQFSLVVVRHPASGLFLIVKETDDRGYWLAGGGVESGEMPAEAALREVREEAGLDVELKGILSVQYSPPYVGPPDSYRMRVIYYAEPAPGVPVAELAPAAGGAGAAASAAPSGTLEGSPGSAPAPAGVPLPALKVVPDAESEKAYWVGLEEIQWLAKEDKLRGQEPLRWAQYLTAGGPIYPLSLFGDESEGPGQEATAAAVAWVQEQAGRATAAAAGGAGAGAPAGGAGR